MKFRINHIKKKIERMFIILSIFFCMLSIVVPVSANTISYDQWNHSHNVIHNNFIQQENIPTTITNSFEINQNVVVPSGNMSFGVSGSVAVKERAQGFESLGAAKGYSRGLWQLTDEGVSSIATNKSWGKFYKRAFDGTWRAVDKAGHGGSAFKVFREAPKGLEWINDANKFGDFIVAKHKDPTGTFIPWGNFNIIW